MANELAHELTNSESIRDFFRKMADGSTWQTNKDRIELLHNSHKFQPRPASQNDESIQSNFRNQLDFGIGLPPMANC
jgi:alpha-D-ribose 1-methylphosphonate 5-phosphate C-P lyase